VATRVRLTFLPPLLRPGRRAEVRDDRAGSLLPCCRAVASCEAWPSCRARMHSCRCHCPHQHACASLLWVDPESSYRAPPPQSTALAEPLVRARTPFCAHTPSRAHPRSHAPTHTHVYTGTVLISRARSRTRAHPLPAPATPAAPRRPAPPCAGAPSRHPTSAARARGHRPCTRHVPELLIVHVLSLVLAHASGRRR
jgi:hypothetical protein